MRGRLVITLYCLICASPAWAQVEPARTGPRDGVWMQASASVDLADHTSLIAQYGDLGGLDVRYVAAEFQQEVAERIAFGAAFAVGERSPAKGPDANLRLYRASAYYRESEAPVAISGRLWAERIESEGQDATEQLRPQVRLSAALPNPEHLKTRLFIANEVFIVAGEGLNRNRLNTGLSFKVLQDRLGIELSYQRTDDRGGSATDRMVIAISLR